MVTWNGPGVLKIKDSEPVKPGEEFDETKLDKSRYETLADKGLCSKITMKKAKAVKEDK